MSPRIKALALVMGALVCLGAAGVMLRGFRGSWGVPEPTVVAGPALSGIDTSLSEPPRPYESSEKTPEMFAYVTGAVVRPGVYSIDENSRIFNLVQSAGGLLPRADAEALNMAAPVQDGAHVHVPLKEPQPVKEPTRSSSSSPGTTRTTRTTRTGSKNQQATIVYINKATAQELTALPGVGPVLAQRILEVRERQGPFKRPEDLLKVSGIGEQKLKRFRSLLRF